MESLRPPSPQAASCDGKGMPPMLAHWLAAAAAAFPERPALQWRQETLDYRELAARTRELAGRLAAAGIRQGESVAIAATRSPDTIIAILAAVEAGAGYVPLDLGYPADRLAAMLAETQPRAVLGEQAALAALARAVGDFPTIEAPAVPAGDRSAAIASLAYVLFTSGSTGKPKGVAMGTLPLRHLIAWHAEHSRLGQAARVLQFAPLSFDVHFQEIFSTLACAGTLVLIDEEARRDPLRLHAALASQRIERLFVPYVALQMVADASQDAVPPALRDVVSAGEQLQVTPSIRSLFLRLPGAQLHNHYGPTESHVVTAHELAGDAAAWPDVPAIGTPLPHVRLALRHADGRIDGPDAGPCAEPAELLIGGDTLAEGYLGRPELTAERFLDGLAALPGRWYATGDLAMRDAGGVLTYFGRADQQVKVDGFRVEPAEIELALMACDGVREAVVTAPDLPGVGKQLVAHLVCRQGTADHEASLAARLRERLAQTLPRHMIPARFVVIERLPTTPSGKIDRKKLPLPQLEHQAAVARSPLELLRGLWQELLGIAPIRDEQNLFDLGARSLLVIRFVSRLRELGVEALEVAHVYDHPTLAAMAAILQERTRDRTSSAASASLPASVASAASAPASAMAVIGMAVRVPDAADLETFWQNLLQGRESIRRFAPDEVHPSVPDDIRQSRNFVAARGCLEAAERFDAGLFGISPREATLLDPQQRLMLELSWAALEHAAIDPAAGTMRVGVYAGTGNNTYAAALRSAQPELVRQVGEFAMMLASEKDYVATRIAHRLNLRGPAISVHTACSTSLVAVAQAWHSLAAGQCDVALAGGGSLLVPQNTGYLHVEGGMESADGHCRPFDADASGTVFSSGGGVVVLKRLDDAVRDHDTVYCIIRGVGLNNDGGSKASFTAPSMGGQAEVIRAALAHAGVDPRSIGYVEAHGTATSLGDPIEVAGLSAAWHAQTADTGFCGIGSVKGNLGHLTAGAGVVGLIKAALALSREVIPATINFNRPNPQIDFAQTPFKVVDHNTPWPRGTVARRAAVSSFGVGGTNAHVVLEEAPAALAEAAPGAAGEPDPQRGDDRLLVLPICGNSASAALRRAAQLADFLDQRPASRLTDVAATLMRGRRQLAHRLAIVASNLPEAVHALRGAGRTVAAAARPRLVFLFPGQGSQHPGMASRLYDEAPAFREALDRALAEVPSPAQAAALRSWMIDAGAGDREAAASLADTRHAQPALLAMSYALACWLDSLGVRPDAMIGHSIGEYPAACLAGVMSLTEAMAAVVARGEAMARQRPGAMLAVQAGVDDLAGLLTTGVEVAAVNAPWVTSVAGDADDIARFQEVLEARGIEVSRLHVSHAFHSAAMEAAAATIAGQLTNAALHPPQVPIYSCVSGAPLGHSEATDPQYWARQARRTVQFSRALIAELQHQDPVFVEVGPGQALTALTRQHRTAQGTVPRAIPLLGSARSPGHPSKNAFAALGDLWCAGAPVAWPVAASARREPLPTYPFEGERYWFESVAEAAAGTASPIASSIAVAAGAAPSRIIHQADDMSRLPRIEEELKRVLGEVAGMADAELATDATFLDQGLDSLALTQFTLAIQQAFDVKLRLRRLMDDLGTVQALARHLDVEIPSERFAAPTALAATDPAAVPAGAGPLPSPVGTVTVSSAGSASVVAPAADLPRGNSALPRVPVADQSLVRHVIDQQMRLMSEHLALLAGGGGTPATAHIGAVSPAAAAPAASPALPSARAAAVPATATQPATQPVTRPAAAPVASPAQAAAASGTTEPVANRALVDAPFGASPRLTLQTAQDLSPRQAAWLQDFTTRYNAKSRKSKAFTQQHRSLMADPRVVTGFHPGWKDLVYPLVVDRSRGARLWDVDGNEYIDLLSGFGGNLLGYQPDEVIAALHQQIEGGFEVGPQHPLSAEVAALIAEFTGMERVAFCNTGSEAVMGAMRIARCVTGRKTIAIFSNSYHGIFDEVIVRGTRQLRSVSAAPGILANAVENIIVLDWASDASLEVLRARGPELAAIMTEPIQNKHPTVQPREFVQALRRIADDAGCALIFDEVVTGFRVAPGGAQEFYGVRADLATYGKVIGGGLPFAAIAGASRWLDALDGGHWQYGDDSYPEAGVTYFAGTFARHPLALAAAHATLKHLKRGGRGLYRRLNEGTQALVDRLNTAFALRGAPVRAVHCTSLWRLHWDADQRYVSLFYYLARFHGLHLYEQFGHFFTEAFGEAESARVFEVFINALDELMGLGFITPRPGGPEQRRMEPETPASAPLTPGQTERWLAGGFDAHARRALNESFCVCLRGDVDGDALRAALADVIARHPAFRLRFDLDEPRQVMDPSATLAVTEVDLRDQPDANEALDAFCTRASERDFPLDAAPLAAVSLLRLADGRTVVHLVASHLIFDGWASSVFNTELAAAYCARSAGFAPHFEPAESPLDFAQAETARFDGLEGCEALAWWQDVLRDPPTLLALGDRVPPSPRKYLADTIRERFDGVVFERIRDAARASGATLFQWLLAAVARMLARRGKQDEFVVSIPFAEQSLACHGPLLADGVLDLPLRVSCPPGTTDAALLAKVRRTLLDALDQPLMTQGTVARALRLPSRGDGPPLTGVFFNLNPKVDLSGWAPLEASMHEGRKRGLLSELFFNFYELPDGLTLDLHHSAEFFSPARAREIVTDLRNVIIELAGGPLLKATATPPEAATPREAAPATPATLPVPLDARLFEWNATDVPLDKEARIEQWVAAQAVATPEACAVIAGASRLTYRDLEARANRYAQVLRQRDIGAGDRVGLSLSRGLQLLPALLGVLKAGAAYVPLDPGFPRERLAYMAEDARLSLVITEAAHADLSGLSRERQLRVDEDATVIDGASAEAPLPAAGGGAATAYVIYTSGSTGRPKGVVLPQRAVCNFLASMRREPGLGPTDRLLAVTTLSFDIAVLELLLPLTCGASVVLAVREDAMDGQALAALVAEHEITVMQATPTTWHLLLDAGWHAPTGFRALCGGEALPPSLALALRAQSVELWNLYGPTETTVWSTLARIDDPTRRITIGHPIANTQVWVLDDTLAPCPVGAEGEICIGGMGLADGYFGQPQLTAERFVTLPSDPRRGERVYRTGDLGRWRVDGELEHLGRLDFQVKLRGYRIELGEIEARLAQAPGVGRAVVVARELTPGDTALVGYVVAQAGGRIESESLREGLKSTLPGYMIPAQVVVLDAMPLLPNGKIDRKSLPQPVVEARTPARTVNTPRTPTERLVADAMAQVLGLAAVGPDDHFFELGGHSLLAAKLAAKLAALLGRQVGQQIRLRTLFEAPVVAALAAAIDAMRGEVQAPSRSPIVHRAEQREAPLTLMQERMRFVEEMHPGRVVYNAPSAHRFKGPMDVAAFDRAFALMVQRQPGLRTAIVRGTAGKFVQRVEPEVAASMLPVVDLSRLAPMERETQLAAMLRALADETFELDRAPLFKVRLFKLAEDEHALFFMAHHIVWDGWSFDVLYAEMSALYESLRHGREPDLAPLPLTYGDYAEWHAAWLQGEEVREQVAHWKKQFEQGAELLPAQTDFPRELATGGRGETCWIGLEAIKLEPVRELARRAGTTTSIVMLAVYSAMMSQWLREPSPSIGMPVRGRGTPELDGIMGFFNNMLPIRLPLEPASTCLQWIASVHGLVAAGYANQDAPFELLAAEIDAGSNGAPATLYQAMFSYQDARARQTRWGNLEHDRIQLLHRGASEDLNLWMVETPAGLEAGLQYNADLFLPATAEALCRRFLALLDAAVTMPEQPVRALMAPGAADLRQLDEWSRPTRSTPEVDLLDAVADFARRDPEHAALRVNGQLVTRATLQERIGKINALLEAAGAPADGEALLQLGDPVAEAAAAFALWQRGMTVVAAPVGVAMDTAGAALVLSDHAPRSGPATETCWIQAGAAPVWPAGEQAARGMALGRSTLDEIVGALGGTIRLLPGDRALCLDGQQPALRLFMLAFALSSGASVDICDGDMAADAERLATFLVGEKIAFLHAKGAVWRDVLAALRGRPLELVAALDVAELKPDLATRLLGVGCSLLSVFRPGRLGMPLAAALVRDARDCRLFGRPLLDGAVLLVDEHGDRVPATVVGELAITIDGVGERSGILARWRSDGQLQYLAGPGAAAPVEARQASRRAVIGDSPTLSPTQQALTQVWQEVLGVDDVGLQDNFFELGGTSLGAMQVAQRLEQRLDGRRVSPRRYVFETLEQLAAALDEEEAAASAATEDPPAPAAPADGIPTVAPGLFQRLKRLAVRA